MRLIDADALRARFQEILDRGDMFCEYDIIGMVDNAPTVEITEEQAIDKLHDTGWLPLHDKEMTERPTGEWLEDSGNIACSHCHTIWLYRRTDFCPNCGVYMKKEAEND